MTQEYLANIHEELQGIPKFQWIKTDRAGVISRFKGVIAMGDEVFVEFQDGSRVKYSLLGDVVMRILDDSMLLDILPTQQANPQGPLPGPQQPQVQIGKVPTHTDSPIYALLNKQKVNKIPIEISIELNLPPVSLYKVLSQSFENADDEIVEFIVSDLDVPMIRESVRSAIANFYAETNG